MALGEKGMCETGGVRDGDKGERKVSRLGMLGRIDFMLARRLLGGMWIMWWVSCGCCGVSVGSLGRECWASWIFMVTEVR